MKLFRSLVQCVIIFSPSPSSPSTLIQPSPSSRHVRPPVMGIQALKNKTNSKQQQQQQVKRSLRARLPPINDDTSNVKSVDEVQLPTNYDMTVLHLNIDEDHDDDDDNDESNSIFASHSSTHQKKVIPQWARKNELQIAICNQLYFQRNPSEIFGNTIDCSPAHLRTVLHSMLPNVQLNDDDRPMSSMINNHSILV